MVFALFSAIICEKMKYCSELIDYDTCGIFVTTTTMKVFCTTFNQGSVAYEDTLVERGAVIQ